MKGILEQQMGKHGPAGVGLFSYLSLIPGPWNLNGEAESAWRDLALLFGVKIPAASAISKAGPNAAEGVGGVGVAGLAGLALSLGATADNIYAFVKGQNSCGCR